MKEHNFFTDLGKICQQRNRTVIHFEFTRAFRKSPGIFKLLLMAEKIKFGNAPIKNCKLLSSFTGMVAYESSQLELK